MICAHSMVRARIIAAHSMRAHRSCIEAGVRGRGSEGERTSTPLNPLCEKRRERADRGDYRRVTGPSAARTCSKARYDRPVRDPSPRPSPSVGPVSAATRRPSAGAGAGTGRGPLFPHSPDGLVTAG